MKITNIILPLCFSLLLVLTQTAKADDEYTVELYDIYCHACHAAKIAGVPQAFSSEWKPRLKKGIKTLVTHAISGYKNMPPMGTCAECTPEDIENLIVYMSKEKK